MRIYNRGASDMQAQESRTGTFGPGIRNIERERPQVVHHAVHATREAVETRVDLHHEFDANRVLNNTYLEAPPPRPGFRQRWVTDGTKPDADNTAQRNWWMKKRHGWDIRDPETVPPDLRHLYPSQRLTSGQDAIRVAGQVLCEMPVQVMQQRTLAVRDLIARQNQAVAPSAEELRKSSKFANVTPMQVEEKVYGARGNDPELRGRSLATMNE